MLQRYGRQAVLGRWSRRAVAGGGWGCGWQAGGSTSRPQDAFTDAGGMGTAQYAARSSGMRVCCVCKNANIMRVRYAGLYCLHRAGS